MEKYGELHLFRNDSLESFAVKQQSALILDALICQTAHRHSRDLLSILMKTGR